jgi:hypothetical protein
MTGGDAPRITSAMSVLAWHVLNGSEVQASGAAYALATLILEAGQVNVNDATRGERP